MPVAVITGSSSGIGRATAVEFARQGYDVVLHARRNLQGLNETACLIDAVRPDEATCYLRLTADISVAEDCDRLVREVMDWQQDVTVWVNNAGADVLTDSAAKLSFEQRLERLLDVDVSGTIRISRLIAQRMAQLQLDNRSIINIGWDQAWTGMEGDAGQLFCTTKSAVEAFSRSLAMSAAPRIRVNCVSPGWIRTAWGAQSASPYWDARARQECLLERWGLAEDVAGVIVWLASPAAAFVNGQCIPVNGGRRLTPALPASQP